MVRQYGMEEITTTVVIMGVDGQLTQDQILMIGYYILGIIMIKYSLCLLLITERHGIVSKRPAEVKFELRLDLRYKHEDVWFGIYYEKQKKCF